METCQFARRAGLGLMLVVVTLCLPASGRAWAQDAEGPGWVPIWPCRLVVKGTLRGVIENGWRRSPTLQRQCRRLGEAGAVVEFLWGRRGDSLIRAISHMARGSNGVVVAKVSIPAAGDNDTIELVAHELEHVLEKVEGIDYLAESKRPGSGVRETRGSFETQRAIDAGLQAAQEMREASSRQPVTLLGHDEDGRAERYFVDPLDGQTEAGTHSHTIWVAPEFIAKVQA